MIGNNFQILLLKKKNDELPIGSLSSKGDFKDVNYNEMNLV